MSARELADQAGMGLTRGVIANLESGRKSDITVDQLIALSTVLGVPAAAIALPVDEPYRFVRMVDSPTEWKMVRAHRAVERFLARDTASWYRADTIKADNQASFVASEIMRAAHHLPRLERELAIYTRKLGEDAVDDEGMRERVAEIETLRRTLLQLGADLTVYKVDE